MRNIKIFEWFEWIKNENKQRIKKEYIYILPPRRAKTMLITVPLVNWYDFKVLSSSLDKMKEKKEKDYITLPFTINRNWSGEIPSFSISCFLSSPTL